MKSGFWIVDLFQFATTSSGVLGDTRHCRLEHLVLRREMMLHRTSRHPRLSSNSSHAQALEALVGNHVNHHRDKQLARGSGRHEFPLRMSKYERHAAPPTFRNNSVGSIRSCHSVGSRWPPHTG